MTKINTKVLMSGAEYFSDDDAINAHMDSSISVNVDTAVAEHRAIEQTFRDAGIEVIKVPTPEGMQDAVYTANWALIRGNKAVMSNLPNTRQPEEAYAEEQLSKLGYEIVKLPEEYIFSGQGDAVPCGNHLFTGSTYRTDTHIHPLLARELGFEVIGLQTIPYTDNDGNPLTNPVTGLPDSFFYDIDLAVAIIDDHTIAWCPEAFVPESQERIHALEDIDKIEVSLEEAMHGFACNLVSTGEHVIMSDRAPQLKAALEARGLTVHTPHVTELAKGGGFIRCTSLTL